MYIYINVFIYAVEVLNPYATRQNSEKPFLGTLASARLVGRPRTWIR